MHPTPAARLLMEYYLGKTMQQNLARLGLLPTTAEASGVDPAVARIETTKLLGTTDPERMNEMLTLAQQIYR